MIGWETGICSSNNPVLSLQLNRNNSVSVWVKDGWAVVVFERETVEFPSNGGWFSPELSVKLDQLWPGRDFCALLKRNLDSGDIQCARCHRRLEGNSFLLHEYKILTWFRPIWERWCGFQKEFRPFFFCHTSWTTVILDFELISRIESSYDWIENGIWRFPIHPGQR